MALTHVCMWSNQKWRRITASEAVKMFPQGASAYSGLFMCELCGQYVSLTGGTVQTRHFRHSAKEQNKDCEDRSDVYGYSSFFEADAHGLPIRLRIKSENRFELEIGLIQIPHFMMRESRNHNIVISSGISSTDRYIYSFSRLNKEGITYLPIGNEIKTEYRVTVSPEIKGITMYWPERIEGLLPGGVVFDATSLKKLPYDADVMIGHKYFIVKRGGLWVSNNSILHSEICVMNIGWESWHVHEIEATEFSEGAAKFFLDYHCRLTDEPVTMYPVWPAHITSPYVIYHQANEITMYFKGNAEIKLAPSGNVRKIPYEEPKMVLVSSSENSRQQLLSAGRTRVLNYTYFWHEELKPKAEITPIVARDLNGNTIQQGINDSLPESRTIIISLNYDGKAIIEENQKTIVKYDIKAGVDFWIDNISYNQIITIYQGCDVVWETVFQKNRAMGIIEDETLLLRRLLNCRGNYVTTSHSLTVLAQKYEEYPQIKAWIYKSMRRGVISRDAIRLLKAGILRQKS